MIKSAITTLNIGSTKNQPKARINNPPATTATEPKRSPMT